MKKFLKILPAIILIGHFILWPHLISGQRVNIDTSFVRKPITYLDFISNVGKYNYAYAAEKFNVSIAEANVLAAGVFPDPELSFGWFDNGQRRMNMGYGFSSELTWTLELGGKRKARVDLAKSQYELSKYLLEDYFRNLRADATLLFLQALQNKLLLDVQINSYQTMNRLAESDSIRFRIGAITETDARQSKLEAGTMLNDVYQAEAEWKMMLTNLFTLTGQKQSDSLLVPVGSFNVFDRTFNLSDLIVTAQNNRADLMAALQNKSVSEKLLRLAKANRVVDLGLSTGVNYASFTRNVIAPTPSFTSVSVGISVPLKFSNNRPGELKAAYYSNLQAEAQYRQVELQIQNEVTQAYFNYMALKKQVQQFNNGLLSDAKAVLEGKIYSYQRGETSLLEVLNAQRTYNDVQQSYYQTLYNYAAALVELERAAGIWDINF
ncbi:MAG: TolC family protein [Chitinophagales bacterium]|nr:TolC family protein [Chitinophagales bacterium]MDW8273561.1 TolC family protein [Chitinophagales bacterium]